MMTAAIILLIVTAVLPVGSFLAKTRKSAIAFGVGYLSTFWLAVVCLSKSVPSMTLERAEWINHNAGFGNVLGAVLILTGCIWHDRIKKKKPDCTEEKTAAGLLAVFGVCIIIACNIMTMTTYVRISQLNEPVVTAKNIDTIYVGEEYAVDDFIEVENSHGEQFGTVKWLKGAAEDTGNIVIGKDRKSFTVLAGNGQIMIQIWVHEAHYSDVRMVTLNVNVDRSAK